MQLTKHGSHIPYVFSLLLFAAGNIGIAGAQPAASGSGESAGQHAIPVTLVTVETQPVEDVTTVLGTLITVQDTWVTPSTAGIITAIHFTPGDQVSSGTLLYQLDDRSVQADAKQVEVEYQQAKDLYERNEKLKQRKLVAVEALVELENKYLILQAQREAMQLRIDLYKIYAPFSGKLGLSEVKLGSYVSPGDALVHLNDASQVLIEFSLPQRLLPQVSTGMLLRLRPTAFPDREFHGEISFVDPIVRSKSREITARGNILDAAAELVPGLSARVDLVLARRDGALVVPAAALTPTLNGARVFKVANGKAQEIDVLIGIRTTDKVEVRSGLSAGDKIVLLGREQLHDGSAVTEVPAADK